MCMVSCFPAEAIHEENVKTALHKTTLKDWNPVKKWISRYSKPSERSRAGKSLTGRTTC